MCAISIEVTTTSRVDVQAAGRDGAALCPQVLAAAKLVEPELPWPERAFPTPPVSPRPETADTSSPYGDPESTSPSRGVPVYIDEGKAAPLDAIGKSMNAFAQSAAAGQFAINQSGGDALLKAITKMAQWVESKAGVLGVLEQEPMLGGSNNAGIMKPYVQKVATDEQGFLIQLAAFRGTLLKAEEGIKQAMENYREVDDNTASRLA